MTNFLDEHFVKQTESKDSMLTFIGYLCLSFVESIGLLLLSFLFWGSIFQVLIEPYFSSFLTKVLGITTLLSIILYSILVPVHTLFKRGNLLVFKGSLLKMNLISIGLWCFPSLLLGLGTYNILIGLRFLSLLAIGIFFTSLRFKYPTKTTVFYAFVFYWLSSILLCYWYNS
jgi:hypothetical protein